jgi:hypothetical protein
MPDDPDVEAAVTRLVRRFRGLSAGAWAVGDRRAAAHRLLATLASLDPESAGRQPPDVADHVWGDAVAVLAGDALAAGASPRAVLEAVEEARAQTA